VNDEIEVRQRISAPLDLIWRACSSGRGISTWQADQAEGDVRLGGTLTLRWLAFGARVDLSVVDFIPYERLVLRHGTSEVELQFDDNLVTLRHRGLESSDDAEGLASSWRIALAQLAHCVERHPGRQRRVSWLVRTLRTSPESAYLGFTDPHLLTQWLLGSGSVPDEGEPFRMWLTSGQLLSGRVLAHVPGRDVVLRCENANESLLTLRTLPSPTSASERIVALVWSEWGALRAESQRLVRDLDAAADRLKLLLTSGGSA
jgi:uncharacterized protein YndB with AHSA1/START domain